ncbi:hypothetical protein SRABI76_01303 [Microbacterium oxydans]|uniref:Lipoprotein n=1 Tax=Microbacterium oxydans TaxID=82380 RepID=A0A0F0LCM1_9MICO|nr:hypothetical protein RS83_01167 [Microbacterium oxydans]CAH0171871.1 hypothetical protein SRABI76_01303 [Microbacterium oxydans]
MDRRSLPLARTAAAATVLLFIGGLAGCDGGQRIYEEAVTEAEQGVALSLEITTTQATDLLAERSAASEISTEDIISIFLTDARNYETEPLDAIQTRALFGMRENSDGSVTFSIFIVDSVYRASGLTTTSQSRHSCGEITGRIGAGVLSFEDLDCPPVFVQRAGDESVSLSMTDNAEKYGVSVGTSP